MLQFLSLLVNISDVNISPTTANTFLFKKFLPDIGSIFSVLEILVISLCCDSPDKYVCFNTLFMLH